MYAANQGVLDCKNVLVAFQPSLSVKLGRVQDATCFLLQYFMLSRRRLTFTRNSREEGPNVTRIDH